MKRSFDELAKVDEPAWPLVQGWIAEAKNQVEVLPPAQSRRDTLVALQVTLRSPMGAIAYETGGILIDHGWLRVLGGGHERLPRTIVGWNVDRKTMVEGERPPFLLVADDVVGGFFAIDGGGWGTQGHVHYFAPDTLRWEDTGMGYSDFVYWAMIGDLAKYYADQRWEGWQGEVERVHGDLGFTIYPPPFAQGEPYGLRTKSLVPITELYDFYQDAARQLKDAAPGAKFKVKVVD